jgi:hypothetical protein
VHPPPSPARANFTLITECTPESSGCNSVYSVGKTVRGRGRGQKDKCGSGVQDTRVGQREDNEKTSGTKVPGVQGDWAKFAQTMRYEYIRGECGRYVFEFSTTRQQKIVKPPAHIQKILFY